MALEPGFSTLTVLSGPQMLETYQSICFHYKYISMSKVGPFLLARHIVLKKSIVDDKNGRKQYFIFYFDFCFQP